MTADTLFENSRKAWHARRAAIRASMLPIRIIVALRQAGYGRPIDENKQAAGPQPVRPMEWVDRAKIKAAVESGEIWDARNLGPRSIHAIYLWLEQSEPETGEL